MISPIVTAVSSAIAKSVINTAGGGGVNIADVFSVDLYTGNSSTKVIPSGLDYTDGESLVWAKNRLNSASHALFDTLRGDTKMLSSDLEGAEITVTGGISFGSSSYSLTGNIPQYNLNGNTYVGWSFRKSPKFFDAISYAGNNTIRDIPHNLGIAPGVVIIRRRNTAENWIVYHVSRGNAKNLTLETSATEVASSLWNNTTPDADNVRISAGSPVNATGSDYIMYVFAHDDSSGGVIQCGEYIGNGSLTGPIITLGWKPQYIMLKRAVGGTGNWQLLDAARGLGDGSVEELLRANETDAEAGPIDIIDLTDTGFKLTDDHAQYNANGSTYIYMAIREE